MLVGDRFAIDVASFNTRTFRQFDQIRRAIFLEIGRRVILKTPVDKGGARGAWQSTVGKAATTNVDRQGTASIAELGLMVQAAGISETMFLTNLMPYIGKLEDGGYPNPPKKGTGKTVGGFSTQAPEGMVRVTLAELDSIVRMAEGASHG